jgi:hypothetical protein
LGKPNLRSNPWMSAHALHINPSSAVRRIGEKSFRGKAFAGEESHEGNVGGAAM